MLGLSRGQSTHGRQQHVVLSEARVLRTYTDSEEGSVVRILNVGEKEKDPVHFK